MALTASAADEQVDRRPQQRERERLEHEPEDQRALGLHVAVGERPVRGAAHHLVAVALDPAVDGVGAAGGERAADEDRDDQRQRRHLARGQDHRRQRGDEQQLDHAGLGEVEVGERGGAGPAGPALAAGRFRRRLRHERRIAPGNLGGLGHSGESSRSHRGAHEAGPCGQVVPRNARYPRGMAPAPPSATTTPSSRSA